MYLVLFLLVVCSKPKTLAPEECLRMKFLELEKIPKAYSCIRYMGTKTAHGTTDFSKLGLCVSDLLKDNSVRASRPLHVIYSALEVSVMLAFLCSCLCAILHDARECSAR